MILKPGFYYSFFRVDEKRYKEERAQGIKYPYLGEILSDSWGKGEPKEQLLWDADVNSGDFWVYSDIYPELVTFVNDSIADGFTLHIAESIEDPKIAPVDYKISNKSEEVTTLDDLVKNSEADSHFVMSHHCAQYFAYQHPIRDVGNGAMLKSKPYLGGEWQEGDKFLTVLFEQPADETSTVDLHMTNINQRNFDVLQKDYDFVRYCINIPVFKRKI